MRVLQVSDLFLRCETLDLETWRRGILPVPCLVPGMRPEIKR